MIGRTHTMRRITVAIVATSLTAWAAQPALPFDGRSPDTREAAQQVSVGSAIDRRSPDARDAGEQGKPSSGLSLVDARAPDTRDAGRQATSRFSIDARSPDTREAAEQAKPSFVVDGRSPDSRDAAQRIPSALSDAWLGVFSARPQPGVPAAHVISTDRFHWGDFGIGVGVTFGSMLLLAGLAASALAARQKRDERTGPATT
jgi:hypothetical protein